MSQDITALPPSIKDFIQRRGYSLNPLCWQTSYQYPEEAKAFTPEQHRLHFFVLETGGQLSLLSRHDPLKRGVVYECGPREVHGAPKPAKPRINLDKPAPIWTADIPDTLPEGKPGVDDIYNPKYFAQLQYLYPDSQTSVITDYLISTPTQTFQDQLKGSTNKLSLFGPEQIRYDVGTPVTAGQWQQAHDALQQSSAQLSEQRQHAKPVQDWPRTVQPLHLINTGILHPGNPKKMDPALFQDDGYPLEPLFNKAREVWEQKCQRPDVFAKRFSRSQDVDVQTLSKQLDQSFGVRGLSVAMVGQCMVDLIYLLDHEDWLHPLKAVAEQLNYANPAAWTQEAALVALICYNTQPKPDDRPGNRSPYFESLQQIGQHLYQLACLQRQQDKVFTQTGQYNCLIQHTLPVPKIGANWRYQPSKNLSKPKRILRLGLFFDGTNQDRYNDEHLPDRDISNVAKMHDLYVEKTDQQGNEIITTRRVYVPGVGTITGHQTKDGFKAEDSKIGLGLGMGKTGGYARIEFAIRRMRERIEEQEYDEVKFDVFGFSRGAALSRHFVNLINQWPEQISIWEVEYHNPLWDFALPIQPVKKRIKAFPQHLAGRVCFVGLWDTVGSFGWPGDEQNLDFNLNLNTRSAERVVHLVAADEARHNFPSTRITDEYGHLPSNFTEIIFPGVHCDVGGGYENPTGKGTENYEDLRIRTPLDYNDNRPSPWVLRGPGSGLLIDALEKEIRAFRSAIGMEQSYTYKHILKATRKELALYPFYRMDALARQADVPLDQINPKNTAYIIPDELKRVYGAWQKAGGQMPQARQYLVDYIHTSEKYGDMVDRPHMENGRKIRQIYDNHPDQAIIPESQHAHH
ncbi:T6SS phospholipase effector Tle1-like catalytic domain-containing protein [Gynuella sunshinyii]|uniref:T6SS Phospholipase effector Tle1-like catalytic domain-containing protein n=1 Tax=Gynuella sunshinyii YC6258 TaxID=1445510 RepID=A0A0C5VJ36_9GAMM|nr:DUF2235 domain-containing protein [Gynuella sunshinyii]AJQ94251.1 hypothetical protein YC6258_02214 [Gynuella sunshinyii YC6258]